MHKLKKVIESYEKFVTGNPEAVSDLETISKWVSYFIAGRISDSNIVSELIYSLSNMLVLYNDRILDKAKTTCTNAFSSGNNSNCKNNNTSNKKNACYRLKVMLTTLEYSEVFIEISAKRLFGNKGRWLFITIIQVTKAISRFFILQHSTEHIITSPAMPTLNRREFIKQHKNGITYVNDEPHNSLALDDASFTIQLKRSGRLIRKVEGAPPIKYREFNLHSETLTQNSIIAVPKQAEYLYIAKPLIHLASVGLFGEKRWKQYAVALTIDLLSIRMYHQQRHLMTKEQKLELSRRSIQLLLYLLRSPFYERFSHRRINGILGFVTNHIPIARMVTTALQDYLPQWQNTYFYLWST